MPRLIKPLAAMLAPALLAACMVAAPTRAAGVSCEAWNTGGFFKRAAAAEVSRCLKAGASTSARNKAGLTPLHVAAEKSKTPTVVKTLLAAGAKVNARKKGGSTPLRFAARGSGTPAVVKALLEAGAKVNARDNDGRTPLHYAARFSKNVEVVKTLLAAGAEPAARDNAGKTPWHYAEENAALKGTEVYWRLNDGRFR